MRATDGTIRIATAAATTADRLSAQVVGRICFRRAVIGAFLAGTPRRRRIHRATRRAATPGNGRRSSCAWTIMRARAHSRRSVISALSQSSRCSMFALACSYPGSRIIDWLVWPAAMFAVVLSPFVAVVAAHANATRAAQPRTQSSCDEPESEASSEHDPPTTHAHPHRRRPRSDSRHAHRRICRRRTADDALRRLLPALRTAARSRGERQPTTPTPTVKLTQVLHNGAQLEVRLPANRPKMPPR